MDGDEPVQLPIDGVLDLHTFQPREVKDVVESYLAECQARGILQVRVIHGRGIGNLRRTVHALLARHSEVISYSLDYPQFGGSGATLVTLRKEVSLSSPQHAADLNPVADRKQDGFHARVSRQLMI